MKNILVSLYSVLRPKCMSFPMEVSIYLFDACIRNTQYRIDNFILQTIFFNETFFCAKNYIMLLRHSLDTSSNIVFDLYVVKVYIRVTGIYLYCRFRLLRLWHLRLCYEQCCGSGPFFSDPDSRIWFFKYGSGSG